VVKNGKVTTATYVAPIGKVTSYEFSIKDSAGATISRSGTIIGNPMTPSPAGMFLIEAEDFNLNGVVPAAQAAVDTMPYRGNAYNGLGATVGIDYFRNDAEGSGNIYRLGETPNVPMSGDGDVVRARDAAGNPTWTVTNNYRLGWSADGRWMNYTRQIPAGTYQVWASLSFGETPNATVIRSIGNLSKVTSDPTMTDQTVETIGYFRAPATGGWGANQLVPLRLTTTDSTGDAAVVSLGGSSPTTLRYEYASGDFDYFILVPAEAGPVPPEITDISISGGNLTITWTGGGTLEKAAVVTGPYTSTGNSSGTYTAPASAAKEFFRVAR
jgi:hypothetical protein